MLTHLGAAATGLSATDAAQRLVTNGPNQLKAAPRITGDHPRTAVALARELGIASGPAAVTGPELDGMPDEDLQRRAPDISVYARVTADHKLRIVRALKATGAVVAMTGDGVNDAPAISGADIGIAMGKSGTEVTRQAADMIITDDNFATIVAAVEEGRGIYDNIRKTLQYLLAGNTGELLLMTACVAGNLPPHDALHRGDDGRRRARRVPLRLEGGHDGVCTHVGLRRAGVRRTPAVLWRSQ